MSESKPLVSVIIPSFNSADSLPFSIKSVVDQSYQNIEIVVVDDGSTDLTKSVIEGLQVKYPDKIKYVYQENGRQGKARNNGIRNSSGELIAFLDADDEWLSNKISSQIQTLDSENADLVYSDGYIIKTDKLESLKILLEKGCNTIDIGSFKGELSGERGKRLIHRKNRLPNSSVLCKRKALEKAGLFIEDLRYQNCEDYLLWIRMIESGHKLVCNEKKLLLYRMHPGSSTIISIKALTPLLNTLFIVCNPPTPEIRYQVAGHMQDYINELKRLDDLNLGYEIFALYNQNVLELKWKITLRLAFNLSTKRIYMRLLQKHIHIILETFKELK